MALDVAGNDPMDDAISSVVERVTQGMREAELKTLANWERTKGVKQVTLAEQAEEREALEAFEAQQAAGQERAAAEVAAAMEEGRALGAMWDEAIVTLRDQKAAANVLAPPNIQTATHADWVRHEERVRADERAKLEAASKPAEPEFDGSYFEPDADEDATLEADTDETADDEPYEPVDELWDPWPDEAAVGAGEAV